MGSTKPRTSTASFPRLRARVSVDCIGAFRRTRSILCPRVPARGVRPAKRQPPNHQAHSTGESTRLPIRLRRRTSRDRGDEVAAPDQGSAPTDPPGHSSTSLVSRPSRAMNHRTSASRQNRYASVPRRTATAWICRIQMHRRWLLLRPPRHPDRYRGEPWQKRGTRRRLRGNLSRWNEARGREARR
jgi:hypothetical protein